MSVFDIVARIKIDDQILGPLRDISREMEDIHHSIGNLTSDMYGLGSAVRLLGPAFVAVGAAGLFALNALAKQGDETLSIISRMEEAHWSLKEVQEAQTSAWATHLAVPTSLMRQNLQTLFQLKNLTGSFDVAQSLLTPMMTQQETLKKWGSNVDLMGFMRAYIGAGMSPQAAQGMIEKQMGTWQQGIVTPEQSLSEILRMKDDFKVLSTNFRENIWPMLETLRLPGGRLNLGQGTAALIELLTKPDEHGHYGGETIRRYLTPGTSLNAISNDPYRFAEQLYKGFEYRAAHGERLGLTAEQMREALAHPNERYGQTLRQALDWMKIPSGPARDMMTQMILQGPWAMGDRSPFSRPMQQYGSEAAYNFALTHNPMEARKGMMSSITSFIEALGESVDKWELPKMTAIRVFFNDWTTGVKKFAEENPEKMNGIISGFADLSLGLMGLGTSFLAIRTMALLWGAGSVGALGLATFAGLGLLIYENWSKNRSALENIGFAFKAATDGILGLARALSGLPLGQGTRTNIDYGRLHPDFGGPPSGGLPPSAFVSKWPAGNEWTGDKPGYGRGGWFMDPAYGAGSGIGNLFSKAPWSSIFPKPAWPEGARAPTGTIGPVFPFGNFGPRAPATFNDRFGFGAGPASPSSLAPSGAISGMGSALQQKAITIATNLNIDGRTLASMVSEHLVGAGDTSGGTYGPGNAQYSAS